AKTAASSTWPPSWPISFTLSMPTAARSTQSRHRASSQLFWFNPCRFDDRPPFLNLGLLKRAERLWGLLLARRNLLDDIRETSMDDRIGEGGHYGGIELRNDVVWHASGNPEPMPNGNVEPRQSSLVDRRNVRRRG